MIADWTDPSAFLYFTLDRNQVHRAMFGACKPWVRSPIKVGKLGRLVSDCHQAAKLVAKWWREAHRIATARAS